MIKPPGPKAELRSRTSSFPWWALHLDLLRIDGKGVTSVFSKKSHDSTSQSLPDGLHVVSDSERRRLQLEDSIRELSELLETYAPRWYTTAHSERVDLALRGGPESLAKMFNELYDLLEEYAPVWYSEEQHKRAESVVQSLKSHKRPSSEQNLARGAASS